MVIRNFLVPMLTRGTVGTMHFGRREVFNAVYGNDHMLVSIFILTDKARFSEAFEAGLKQRAQQLRIYLIKNTSHLIITGNRSFNSIDVVEIVFLRRGLSFEIEQRGRFERKHGESGFQDIRQLVVDGITGPLVGKGLKLFVQKSHHLVKRQRLLVLRVILWHSPSLQHFSGFVLRTAGFHTYPPLNFEFTAVFVNVSWTPSNTASEPELT